MGRTVLDEFFRVKMRETFYETVEALQTEFDACSSITTPSARIWVIATRADGSSKP